MTFWNTACFKNVNQVRPVYCYLPKTYQCLLLLLDYKSNCFSRPAFPTCIWFYTPITSLPHRLSSCVNTEIGSHFIAFVSTVLSSCIFFPELLPFIGSLTPFKTQLKHHWLPKIITTSSHLYHIIISFFENTYHQEKLFFLYIICLCHLDINYRSETMALVYHCMPRAACTWHMALNKYWMDGWIDSWKGRVRPAG